MRRAEDLRPKIIVNVYHASEDGSSAAFGIPGCCGAYHTGVEINGVEYAFAGVTGVYECTPGDYGQIIDKFQYQSEIPHSDVRTTIDSLRQIFGGDKYHVILNNCNNFSDAVVRACTGRGIPAWINRGAWWLSWFKCCFSMFGDGARNRSPVLNSHPVGPPRQLTPIFSGQGVTTGGDRRSRPLTSDEQREVRLRNFGSSQHAR
jgi:hypothetical protein